MNLCIGRGLSCPRGGSRQWDVPRETSVKKNSRGYIEYKSNVEKGLGKLLVGNTPNNNRRLNAL
jgi:hypothetical protein